MRGETAIAREKKLKFQDEREEIAYLRQQFSSMSMRGRYKECFRLIESKLKLLYFQERWPEQFVSSLLIHQRCFPSMGIHTPYEEYLAELLRKNGIPTVFVELMRGRGRQVSWRADFFQEKALEYKTDGQHDKALDYVELLLKTDPLNSNAYLIKGLILWDMGRRQEAIAAYQQALQRNKNNYQAVRQLGEAYIETDLDKALEFVQSAIQDSPGDPELQAAKSRILIKQNDLEGALAALDEANSLDPLNPTYFYQKGELYRSNAGDLSAIRQYGLALALDENHLPSLTRLAFMTAQEQPEQALKYTAAVAAARPEDQEIALLWARLLERLGDTPKAIRQYGKALELDENRVEAWAALGRLHRSGAPQKALAYFQKAAELEPARASHRMGTARAYQELGEEDAALTAYQEAVERDKTFHQAYAAMGALLMERDPKAAMQHINRAIALDPKNPRYYQSKGELLTQNPGASRQDILTCYHQAVKLDPGDAGLRVVLGSLLEEMGSAASAAEHYRAAVGLSPDEVEAHRGLARLLLDSEPVAALRHIDRAIFLRPNQAEQYYLKSRIYTSLGRDPEMAAQLQAALVGETGHDDALKELAQLLDGDAPRVAMMYINRALEIAPHHPVYLCERARLLEALGDRKTALAQYRHALEADPDCHRSHYGLGRLLGGRDDKAALEHLERAEALDPANPLYTAEKARCLARDPHRYTQALDCFDQAIAKDNTMWDILLDKARLLDAHGEALPATVHYRRVLLLAPDCIEANARMGALLAEYNPRAALAYIERAAALQPEHYGHHLWRSYLLYLLGEESKAEQAVEDAVRLGEEIGQVYRDLVRILTARRPSAALHYCDKLIELEPEQAEHLLLRGHILLAMQQPEQAVRSYQKALALAPDCHEALARIAEILYRDKDAESLSYIDRALEINAGNASYHYIRGLILAELLEDPVQAVIHVETAVKLAPGHLIYRERLVELLGQTRSRLARLVQKRKLNRLRRRMLQMEKEARQEAP